MNNIPDEVILNHIIKYLYNKDILSLASTNIYYQHLIKTFLQDEFIKTNFIDENLFNLYKDILLKNNQKESSTELFYKHAPSRYINNFINNIQQANNIYKNNFITNIQRLDNIYNDQLINPIWLGISHKYNNKEYTIEDIEKTLLNSITYSIKHNIIYGISILHKYKIPMKLISDIQVESFIELVDKISNHINKPLPHTINIDDLTKHLIIYLDKYYIIPDYIRDLAKINLDNINIDLKFPYRWVPRFIDLKRCIILSLDNIISEKLPLRISEILINKLLNNELNYNILNKIKHDISIYDQYLYEKFITIAYGRYILKRKTLMTTIDKYDMIFIHYNLDKKFISNNIKFDNNNHYLYYISNDNKKKLYKKYNLRFGKSISFDTFKSYIKLFISEIKLGNDKFISFKEWSKIINKNISYNIDDEI